MFRYGYRCQVGLWPYEMMVIWIQTTYMVSITGSVAVPLSADVTTANVQDNRVYGELTCSLPSTTIKETSYMTADPGYDDHELYDLSMSLGFQLLCPVYRYRNTPKERLKLVDFYESALGQVIYSNRGTSMEEPLIEHIKSIFRVDPLPVR